MDFRKCFCSRKTRYSHACILVGPIIYGSPVAPFNRRVLHVPVDSCHVEAGSFAIMRAGGGKLQDIECLGRIAVPLEKHLHIVEMWINEALDGAVGGISSEVIKEVKERINSNVPPSSGVETMDLEVFSAVVVNRMKDGVFVYKAPTSFA